MSSTLASPSLTTTNNSNNNSKNDNSIAQIAHPAYKILSKPHASTLASKIFTDKIKNKPLLLTPSNTNTTNTDKRALRRKIRAHKRRYHLQHQKPRPLSAKEKRSLKLYELQPREIKYEIYKGLNTLWRGYILEVLGFVTDKDGRVAENVVENRVVTQAGHGSLLASADFHGMEVEVVRCVDVGRVGLKGIVVRETKGTVVVVTEKDAQRRILKRGTVFRVVVELPGGRAGEEEEEEGSAESGAARRVSQKRKLVFELHGEQLEVRPVERATRKFKWKPMDYL